MPIEHRASAGASDVTGDMTITIPATVESGDIMVITWHVALDLELLMPAGWAYLPEAGTPGQHTVGTSRAAGIYKIADADDAGTVLDLGTASEEAPDVKQSCRFNAWSGVDQTSPFDGTPLVQSSSSVSGTSHPSPSIVTTANGAVVVTTTSFKDSSVASITPPSGWTGRGITTMTGGGRSSTAHASKEAPTGGTYGGETWTTDATPSSRCMFTFALAPSVTTQTIRPVDDVTATNVEDQGGGTVDLYTAIDETVLNLADYVRFVEGATYEVLLAAAVPPPAGAGARADYVLGLGDGAAAATWTVGLYDGATQIAEWVDEITEDPTVVSHTLTSGEVATITDWSDLRYRITLTSVTG